MLSSDGKYKRKKKIVFNTKETGIIKTKEN